MTYSPYGDRDSGGTRTDVDTEVHDDHDHDDRGHDGIGHDANGRDANDRDANEHGANEHGANEHGANEHGGSAAPFQRDPTDDESIGGEVVDRDGNVVEATGADVNGGDRPETVDAESVEPAGSAESTEAAAAVDAEQAHSPDAEQAHSPDAEQAHSPDAEGDNVAVADTEAGTDEDRDGDVRTDEATATDADASERADGTAERDSATEQPMAGDDRPTDVCADLADEHPADEHPVDEHPADVVDERNEANAVAGGERLYADGEPDDTAYDDAIDADPTAVRADPTEAGANPYDTDTDTDTDRTEATDGALDSDGATEVPDGDIPVRAVDADCVAVGVAEPMSESAVADVAGPEGSDATRAADDGGEPLRAEPLSAEPLSAEPFSAEPFDAAAEDGSVMDGTAVGMMPGDAPVPDAPAQVPNADATHDRWQRIQLGFIDDPRGSVESARSLVVEAVEARISALRDRQAALDGWQNEATPDTEVLRAAIQGYRDMLHSLTDTP